MKNNLLLTKSQIQKYLTAFHYRNLLDIFESLLIVFQTKSNFLINFLLILVLLFTPFRSPIWVASILAMVCFLYFGLISRINYKIGNKKLGLLSLFLGVVMLFLHVLSISGYSLMGIIHTLTNR